MSTTSCTTCDGELAFEWECAGAGEEAWSASAWDAVLAATRCDEDGASYPATSERATHYKASCGCVMTPTELDLVERKLTAAWEPSEPGA